MPTSTLSADDVRKAITAKASAAQSNAWSSGSGGTTTTNAGPTSTLSADDVRKAKAAQNNAGSSGSGGSTNTGQGNSGDSSNTTNTTTTTTTTTTPTDYQKEAAKYTASNLDDVVRIMGTTYDEDGQPMDDKAIAKMRKRKRAEGIISRVADGVSAISNLIATHNYAPNANLPSMSERTRQRWDKEKAARDAEKERQLNYALQMAKLKDAEQEKGFRTWQSIQQLQQQDRNLAQQAAAHQDEMNKWNLKFSHDLSKEAQDQANNERDFAEGQRRFDENLKNQKARLNIEYQNMLYNKDRKSYTFSLGAGEDVTIGEDKFNDANIGKLFGMLPDSVRSTAGKPIYTKDYSGKAVLAGYNPPTREDMLRAVGACLGSDDADDLRNAVRILGGKKPVEKPKAYGGGSDKPKAYGQ